MLVGVNVILAFTVAPQPEGRPVKACDPVEYKNGPALNGEVKVTEMSQIVAEQAQSARLEQLSEVEPPLFVTVTAIGLTI